MKTNTSFTLNPCQSVRVGSWQPDTETTKRPSFSGWVLLIVMMLTLVVPLAAFSKGPPEGKGKGGGGTVVTPDQVDYGDIFGDLIHIYRDEVTGQPIFAQRWVELPRDIPGYGWGYCAIVETDLIDGIPTRIPFAPYSCDVDTATLTADIAALAAALAADRATDRAAALAADFAALAAVHVAEEHDTEGMTDEQIEALVAEHAAELAAEFAADLAAELAPELAAELAADLIVEVDYFGRLNGSRTRENNLRMHFDEVISNINQAVALKLGPVGRLMLEFCETWEYDLTLEKVCTSYAWSTIDSPMESLGLYTRLSRYGHLGTDPLEEDLFWHGDPALYEESDPSYPTHPALTVEDFQKFTDAGLGHLLPAGTCWVNGEFLCAAPEALEAKDFDSSAVYLGAAASKTGWVTVDLLQYLNRFTRVSVGTADPNEPAVPPSSYEPVESLPALYEDCWTGADPDYQGEDDEEGEYVVESEDPPAVPDLVYGSCITCTAGEIGNDDNTSCLTEVPENYGLYAKMQERFMNFENSQYTRGTRPNAEFAQDSLIMPLDGIEDGSLNYLPPLSYLSGAFSVPQTVDLIEWLEIPNPLELNPGGTDFDYGFNIANYVIGANDAARSIELIHNYEVPDDLLCKYLDESHGLFVLVQCPTID